MITNFKYNKRHPSAKKINFILEITTKLLLKKLCSDSKAISEKAIEDAFVESYRLLCSDNKEVLEELLKIMEENLNSSSVNKQITKIDKEINALEKKKNKLIDMRLEDSIDKATYEAKYADLILTQENLIEDRKKLGKLSENEKEIKHRLKEFKNTLEQNEVLEEFDRYVFESVVEKVIIGGIDEDGNKDSAQITFVYKTGFKSSLSRDKFKPQRKNARGRHRTDELCSHDNNEVEKLCSDSSSDTYRNGNRTTPKGFIEILNFKHFVKHTVFERTGEKRKLRA